MLPPEAVGPEQSGKPSGFLSGRRPFTRRGPTFLRSWRWLWARPVHGPPWLDLQVVAMGSEKLGCWVLLCYFLAFLRILWGRESSFTWQSIHPIHVWFVHLLIPFSPSLINSIWFTLVIDHLMLYVMQFQSLSDTAVTKTSCFIQGSVAVMRNQLF